MEPVYNQPSEFKQKKDSFFIKITAYALVLVFFVLLGNFADSLDTENNSVLGIQTPNTFKSLLAFIPNLNGRIPAVQVIPQMNIILPSPTPTLMHVLLFPTATPTIHFILFPTATPTIHFVLFPTSTPTPIPSATPYPTYTPYPTNIPEPTFTPIPTSTPVSTQTYLPVPTSEDSNPLMGPAGTELNTDITTPVPTEFSEISPSPLPTTTPTNAPLNPERAKQIINNAGINLTKPEIATNVETQKSTINGVVTDKLLGIIPVSYPVVIKVNTASGEIENISKPWWRKIFSGLFTD
jgi:hypothetical protein